MSSVGIRELKAQTSAVLRRVEAGEAVDVTHHGRVIARIVPVKPREEEIAETLAILDEMDALVAEITRTLPANARAEDITDDLRREL